MQEIMSGVNYLINTVGNKLLNKEQIKTILPNSLIDSRNVETEELKEQADKVEKLEEAAIIVKEYEDILKPRKKYNRFCLSSRKSV